MAEVVEQFKLIRSLTARLRKVCSHMIRIYVLAHHTTGACWDTVAQLCFREEWDHKMLAVQDGFTPLKTWEEKVTAAMRLNKQDKHLSKEGVPLGPLCQRLSKKHLREEPHSHHENGRSRASQRGGSSKSSGGKSRGGRGGRHAGGKENSNPSRSSGAAAPAAAPGAVAAAAAGATG
jgi:hypothetical protein